MAESQTPPSFSEDSDSSSQTSDSDSSSQTSDSDTEPFQWLSTGTTDPTSVKDPLCVRTYSPGNKYSDLAESFGKWMVFRPFTLLDETWHMIRNEVECGVLADSAVATDGSTMFYHPTAYGPGPNTSGVIEVHTTEKNIDTAGFILINLVHHDIKFKTMKATGDDEFIWKRQRTVCLRTLYWNSGKPSSLLQGDRCFEPDRRIRDEWHLNYVTAPERMMSRNFDYGRWVLTLKSHAKLSRIWHNFKRWIERGYMGPVEMVCPPKINWNDVNEEPVFLVYTARKNREYVGRTLSTIVKIVDESNEVTSCLYEVHRRSVENSVYNHSVVWENNEPI